MQNKYERLVFLMLHEMAKEDRGYSAKELHDKFEKTGVTLGWMQEKLEFMYSHSGASKIENEVCEGEITYRSNFDLRKIGVLTYS